MCVFTVESFVGRSCLHYAQLHESKELLAILEEAGLETSKPLETTENQAPLTDEAKSEASHA
eukprot:m.114486 g.114486  ORF g.114486 m.114486 type:complete len:62 (-) comp14168_c0_seq3:195-380(-)